MNCGALFFAALVLLKLNRLLVSLAFTTEAYWRRFSLLVTFIIFDADSSHCNGMIRTLTFVSNIIMNKILVTTDLSTPSKAGLRFAMQLATQMEVELVFFHCFQALIPTSLHRERIENTMQKQIQEQLVTLEKFVLSLYKSMNLTPGDYRCAVIDDFNPENAILEYAHRNNFDYVCISTRGAGNLRRIIGTNTGNVLLKSSVPVLAIPHTYRARPVIKALYASDLENLDKEISAVSAFTNDLKIRMDLAYFHHPAEIKLDREMMAEMWRKKYKHLNEVYFEQFPLDEDFIGQLNKLVKKVKPSVVVFFTHTNLTWFDKLFSASKSEAFSFVTKVPMLVFRKT